MFKEKRELNMYDEQCCFLTILAYYLGSIDCCYIKLTSILFVSWDTLDCEQEKQYVPWKDWQDNCRIQNTKKKKPNKQTKEKTPPPKNPIKLKDKKPNKKQNQSGIVFSVFRDICVNILQKHRYILQYQITPCI